MAQPPRYERDFDFTEWAQSRPKEPLPGDRVDAELDAIDVSLTATQDNLGLLQRDDGELANETVGMEQLKPELIPQLDELFVNDPGPMGPAGPSIPGPVGLAGPDGQPMPWLIGSGVPSNAIGIVGQAYLNADNGDVYQKTLSGWVQAANIRGPSGFGTGTGATDHGVLTGLGDPDHPIAAVQGLQTALTELTQLIATVDAGQNRVFRQPEAPTANGLNAGDLWVDTDAGNLLYYWDGDSWIDIADARIGTALGNAAAAIDAASQASDKADGKITTYYAASAPIAEAVGDLWFNTALGNVAYRWNGTSWIVIQDASIAAAMSAANNAQTTADGKIVTYYAATAPGTLLARTGDLWFDTDDDNHPYRFNGATWVSVRDLLAAKASADAAAAIAAAADAKDTADGKIEVFYQSTGPVGAHSGDLWIDTDDKQLYRWSGTQWVSVQDGGISAALTAAGLAITTADGKLTAFYATTAPDAASGRQVGDLWFDTDDYHRPYRFNGTSWEDISWLKGVVGGEVGTSGIVLDAVTVSATSAATKVIPLLNNASNYATNYFLASSWPAGNSHNDYGGLHNLGEVSIVSIGRPILLTVGGQLRGVCTGPDGSSQYVKVLGMTTFLWRRVNGVDTLLHPYAWNSPFQWQVNDQALGLYRYDAPAVMVLDPSPPAGTVTYWISVFANWYYPVGQSGYTDLEFTYRMVLNALVTKR